MSKNDHDLKTGNNNEMSVLLDLTIKSVTFKYARKDIDICVIWKRANKRMDTSV